MFNGIINKPAHPLFLIMLFDIILTFIICSFYFYKNVTILICLFSLLTIIIAEIKNYYLIDKDGFIKYDLWLIFIPYLFLSFTVPLGFRHLADGDALWAILVPYVIHWGLTHTILNSYREFIKRC